MKLYHGSNKIVECPMILLTTYRKDFGWGFYTTENHAQAERWARRRALKEGIATVSEYEYAPNPDLNVLKFEGMTDAWLDFVASCRKDNAIQHAFDIVSGPMADDEVWTYVDDYLKGAITWEAFFELCKFKHPTQQTSFHTARVLETIKFLGGQEV